MLNVRSQYQPVEMEKVRKMMQEKATGGCFDILSE